MSQTRAAASAPAPRRRLAGFNVLSTTTFGKTVEVKLRVFMSYDAALNALVKGNVDIARFGPAALARLMPSAEVRLANRLPPTTASATRILEHIGEPTKPPMLSPARGPPSWETFDQTPVFDPVTPASAPEFEVDQTVTW